MAKTAKKKPVKRAKKAAPKARKPAGKTLPLFTIGYEQAKPAAVLDELQHARIDTLVDVRAVAASRRPGFSKRQLAASLDDAGIAYLHFQKLGTPAEGRQAARAGDRDKLMTIYEKHIRKPEPQAELADLAALVKSGKRIALLCYCRDPRICHRWTICTQLEARLPLKVEDLIPPLF
ncbi:MAG TPA: DUF488 domain-containing protein [Pseudolabrys sp.]|jgi:uncharacterized protein (DUF488 family)|nr:DUF488 domain-containing protein [Pseudolabrys sp.]